MIDETFGPLPAARYSVVGLMGFGGVGKSEVARRLREVWGFQTPHVKTPFVRMFEALLAHLGYDAPTITRFIDGDLKRELIPELGRTSTEIQQSLGTEWGRRCIRWSIWADLWALKADKILAAGGRAAIESVRFPEEADAVRSRDGVLIEVRRPGYGAINGHTSEAIPCEPDLVIDNDGDLADLAAKVDAALS